jgi:hypothetical protein
MPNPDGSDDTLEISLLRSADWLDQRCVKEGAEIVLELDEMGLRGPAWVVGIGPCPPVETGAGRVVTGTIAHRNGHVLRLRFEGVNGCLEPTERHAIYSDTRDAWIPAGLLKAGECLRTLQGTAAISSIESLPGVHRVCNVEVEVGHRYYAGVAEVLSHNNCSVTPPKRVGSRVASNPMTGRFDTDHKGPRGYDKALESARRNAGDLGQGTKKMYDPETGTLIGEMSADGKRGWRIDVDHANFWDWSGGKKGTGGKYGHEYFPVEQSGPHSKNPGYAQWE